MAQLIPGWKTIAKKAWSVRLILVAGFFSGVETAIQIYSAYGFLPAWMPKGGFALLGLIASFAALVSRFVAQKGLTDGE